MKKYVVKKEESGQTLEKFVKKQLHNAPLSFIYKLFRKKDVRINNHWEKEKAIVNEGDEISIYVTDDKLAEFISKKTVKINDEVKDLIIYEDDNVLIVNKPRGLLVQKASIEDKALDDMVLSYLVSKDEYNPNDSAFTPGPAHRLDRNTAGLVIFGKNLPTLQYLQSLIGDKNKLVKKYLTLVKGKIEHDGEVNVPLKKNANTSMVKVSTPKDGGKEAITKYHVVKNFSDYTLLEVTLLTGRMHQIRVHMSYINHPVVGDNKYGDYETNHLFEKKYNFKNQFLIAYCLEFYNVEIPLKDLNNKRIKVELPKEMGEIINNL